MLGAQPMNNRMQTRVCNRKEILDAVFWSPRGSLILRAKPTSPDWMKQLVIRAMTNLCDGKDGFHLLERPPLSLLKITGLATTGEHRVPLNPDQILMEFFDDPPLADATF